LEADLGLSRVYDAVLVVGDLAGFRWSATLSVAREVGGLGSKALVMPGNHDGPNPLQLLAEVAGTPRATGRFAPGQVARCEALREALGQAQMVGYSAHEVGPEEDRVTIVAARPHSMGGPSLSFPTYLQQAYGITSLAASVARMCAVIDSVSTERIVFLAHNGPTGLGANRADIWGCDFRAAQGDWGDPDLAEAIAYAKSRGKRVLAVVAGHMHRKLRGGGQRVWRVERDGVLYLNTARVPRIDRSGRHHLHLEIDGERVSAEDRLLKGVE